MKRSMWLPLALLLAFPAWAEETLVLVVVDGKPVSEEPQMLDPEALPFAPQEWQAWGVVVPKTLRSRNQVSAKELGVAAEYDALAAEVRISIPATLRPSKKLGYAPQLPEAMSPAPKGVMVDYDVAAVAHGDTRRLSLGHVARSGVAGGVLTSTGQANWVDGQSEYIRGTTTWQRDSLKSRTSLQLGDVGLASNGLNNPAVLGGMRMGTDRQLTRYGGGYDIPLIGGLADTRSTAEVLVNEHQRATGQVSPGPYELSPGIAVPGLNHLEVIQRDEFGREQSFSRSFYTHPDLLRKGNKEWDVVAGAVRTNPTKDRYDGWAAQGSVRFGLSDRWTIGATTQAGKVGQESGRNLTLHNTMSLGSAGLVQADVSASQRDDGTHGTAYRVAYERRSPNWSVAASHLRKSDDYWEISQLQDSPFRIQSQTTAAFAFHPKDQSWRATLSYSNISYNDDRRLQQVAAMASLRQERATWLLGGIHDLQTGDNQLFLGVHLRTDRGNVMATAKAAPHVGPSLDAVYSGRTELGGRDVRYQVGGTLADSSQVYGRVDTKVAGGDLTLEARQRQAQALLLHGRYANSVWIGEGGALNGRGYNPAGSFAIVEVPGQPGIDVRGSNRPSKTNRKGYALVSGLNGLTPSPVVMDANQLPVDQQIEDSQQTVVPPRKGGTKVVFPLTTQTARQWEVRLDETYAPEAARVVSDQGEAFLLGERGALVLKNPAARATLEYGSTKCELVLPKEGGVVVCTP
ncbi:fimbria/pilus outer membrane usher protein [Stenotrophomonas maltophilia group sp. CASM26]|uniref:fimbria/pilus outer membrane usher protein n=1 Tax=Stenotrophomonas maltophilia group sp. CASM26 TaxID=3111514 RepID=UPI003BF7CCC1